MAEILFIKTSSLGDVVHHMPAITDARRHLPDARMAWVVEEDYVPLARLHPGVDEVIPVATRRWRGKLFTPNTWREILGFRNIIRARSYQATIDTQGLLRTAVIANNVRGTKHGYDRASIREPLACRFYDVRHRVKWHAHAIVRNRALCGLALGYEPKQPLDFGLDRAAIARTAANVKPYAVLIHATAQSGKLWAQAHWVAVARGIRDRGFDVVLPWGATAERARSVAIATAAGIGQGLDHVPDRRPLDAVAAQIAGASFVIGVDTGLVHVAAALGVPLVAIFIDSEPGLTGPMGAGPIAVVGGKGAAPAPLQVLHALDRVLGSAP
ncbi:MAG TPA: lipopolysaccharide heptosyltransferase I [Xanthobacteraceae bacterium]|nr:lipopolysaccharide heptosyltransferase I [Xanthobacteraceae bacterium]